MNNNKIIDIDYYEIIEGNNVIKCKSKKNNKKNFNPVKVDIDKDKLKKIVNEFFYNLINY